MKVRFLAALAAGVSALFLGASVAMAATVTETYKFSATFGPGAPIQTWTGTFTLTYDPTVDAWGTLDAFSSNLPAAYDGNINEWAYNAAFGLAIGSYCGNISCYAYPGDGYTAAVSASGFAEIGPGFQGPIFFEKYETRLVSVTAVPEAGTLAMAMLGLAGIAAVARRQRGGNAAGLSLSRHSQASARLAQ
jgi:MYXO-CTERM domain-containing protein